MEKFWSFPIFFFVVIVPQERMIALATRLAHWMLRSARVLHADEIAANKAAGLDVRYTGLAQ